MWVPHSSSAAGGKGASGCYKIPLAFSIQPLASSPDFRSPVTPSESKHRTCKAVHRDARLTTPLPSTTMVSMDKFAKFDDPTRTCGEHRRTIGLPPACTEVATATERALTKEGRESAPQDDRRTSLRIRARATSRAAEPTARAVPPARAFGFGGSAITDPFNSADARALRRAGASRRFSSRHTSPLDAPSISLKTKKNDTLRSTHF